MFGGGIFTKQNKALPGAYINFISAARATALLSERGTVAIPLVLNWGPEGETFEVTAQEFSEDSRKIFGYPGTDARLWPVREAFQNMTKGVFYRLNGGEKAACEYAAAKYSGTRGNSLKLVVRELGEKSGHYEVITLLDNEEIDRQTVAGAGALSDNDFVIFKKEAELKATAGLPLQGGTDGAEVTEAEYSAFLNKIESSAFHILCCPSKDSAIQNLFVEYTVRMREEYGIKFQTVVYRKADADYEGIISVENKAAEEEIGLVYWVAGVQAACAVNRTAENKIYEGELTIDADYTQEQLIAGIRGGKFMFHKVGKEFRTLKDINTLVTFTEEKREDFGSNQTIRILDQMGNDFAALFNTRYNGLVPNDASGRVSFWSDVVTYCKELVRIRAIEEFDSKEITVEAGNDKHSVVAYLPVTPINCMNKLYMTVVVR